MDFSGHPVDRALGRLLSAYSRLPLTFDRLNVTSLPLFDAALLGPPMPFPDHMEPAECIFRSEHAKVEYYEVEAEVEVEDDQAYYRLPSGVLYHHDSEDTVEPVREEEPQPKKKTKKQQQHQVVARRDLNKPQQQSRPAQMSKTAKKKERREKKERLLESGKTSEYSRGICNRWRQRGFCKSRACEFQHPKEWAGTGQHSSLATDTQENNNE